MKTFPKHCYNRASMLKQRGLVLFFALVALVVMSLAAVALIRSVDTSTMIAGNLSFKQAATTSGDVGINAAITWLTATQAATALNVYMDLLHPFNQTNMANGYHSSVDPNLNLFADATWNLSAIPEITDSTGNTIRYIIQRMCRTPNALIRTDDCLFSGAILDKNNQTVALAQDVCLGVGCPVAGQSPQIRITARTRGPKNTVSYVQAFVF